MLNLRRQQRESKRIKLLFTETCTREIRGVTRKIKFLKKKKEKKDKYTRRNLQ